MNVVIKSIVIFLLLGSVAASKKKAKAYIFKAADLVDGATPKKIGYIEFIEAGDIVIVRLRCCKKVARAILTLAVSGVFRFICLLSATSYERKSSSNRLQKF